MKNIAINLGKKILLETADGFGGAENGAANPPWVKCNQGAIAFLDFNDAVLDWHQRDLYQ